MAAAHADLTMKAGCSSDASYTVSMQPASGGEKIDTGDLVVTLMY